MKHLPGAAATLALTVALTLAQPFPVDARVAKDDPSLPTTGKTVEEPAREAAPAADEPTITVASGRPHAELIARHADAAGVPVGLAKAVVRVESNFNPRARGRSGEVGLMQIMPATARGIGYAGSTEALYDPDTNLQWGMKYLAGAYQLAGGDLCGTIMRYQGGHHATRMNGANRTYCGQVKRFMSENGFQVAGG